MPTTQKLKLYSYDANPDGSVKISSLMKYFQQIAREDLDSYGITYNIMRDANQVFVIIKAKIEIKNKISIYDDLTLTTVPTKISGITFFRDFFITDSKGVLCAACSTAWVLMNFATRRILKPSDIVAEIPSFPEQASDVILSRRFTFADSPASASTNVRKIYYSNLDENNHFNNAETAGFAVDEIADRLCSGETIKTFELHFNHESVLGDNIEISTQNREKTSFISAFNPNFDSNAFECLIEFC